MFKQAVRLTKQATQITAVLDGINPLNAGKKRDEAVALLQKFFLSMECLESQLKKYRREFDRLEKENTALAKKAEAGEKVSIGKRMEQAYHSTK